MLKMACVKDAELFYMLENHGADFINDKFQVRPCKAAISAHTYHLNGLQSHDFKGSEILLSLVRDLVSYHLTLLPSL